MTARQRAMVTKKTDTTLSPVGPVLTPHSPASSAILPQNLFASAPVNLVILILTATVGSEYSRGLNSEHLKSGKHLKNKLLLVRDSYGLLFRWPVPWYQTSE